VIDLVSILESFDMQRRVIWNGLVAERTLREIGHDMGLSHQQVHKRSREVLNRVARYFEIAGKPVGRGKTDDNSSDPTRIKGIRVQELSDRSTSPVCRAGWARLMRMYGQMPLTCPCLPVRSR
jgi:hypothetical protein